MKTKLFILLLVLALGGFSFYIFRVNKERLGSADEQKNLKIISIDKNSESNQRDANSSENTTDKNNDEEKPINITVKPSDCDNECSKFENNEAEQEYCERVCGISDLYVYDEEEEKEADSEEPTDCSKKTGLKKDYCLKDQAVNDGDFETCDEISDATIKKSCQNRLMEDVLEEQMSQR